VKVLVVEDEWLVRELIVGELLDAGFDVVVPRFARKTKRRTAVLTAAN